MKQALTLDRVWRSLVKKRLKRLKKKDVPADVTVNVFEWIKIRIIIKLVWFYTLHSLPGSLTWSISFHSDWAYWSFMSFNIILNSNLSENASLFIPLALIHPFTSSVSPRSVIYSSFSFSAKPYRAIASPWPRYSILNSKIPSREN